MKLNLTHALLSALIFFAFQTMAHAKITELECVQVGFTTEDSSNSAAVAELKTIRVADSTIEPKLFTAIFRKNSGQPLSFQSANSENVDLVEFKKVKDKKYDKMGVLAFKASNASILDIGYGDQFWVFVDAASLNESTIKMRVWAATFGEPDVTGHQRIYSNTNINFECEAE